MNMYKVRLYDSKRRKYEMVYVMSEKGRDDVELEVERRLKPGFVRTSVRKCRNIEQFIYLT